MVVAELELEEVRFIPDWALSAMQQPTYSEARTWFQWLNVFVPSDVADAMGVSDDVAERYCKAGVWHGIIVQTDDYDGREYIYEYVPLPPGPTHHFTHRPEWRATPGCYADAPVRGLPIRLIDKKNDRKAASTPGSRGVIKRREARYKAMQDAIAKRQAKARERNDERKGKKKSILANF